MGRLGNGVVGLRLLWLVNVHTHDVALACDLACKALNGSCYLVDLATAQSLVPR